MFPHRIDLVSISPKDKWREGYHQEIWHSGWYQYKFGQYPETWAYPRMDACYIKNGENVGKLKSVIVVFDLTHHYVGQLI